MDFHPPEAIILPFTPHDSNGPAVDEKSAGLSGVHGPPARVLIVVRTILSHPEADRRSAPQSAPRFSDTPREHQSPDWHWEYWAIRR